MEPEDDDEDADTTDSGEIDSSKEAGSLSEEDEALKRESKNGGVPVDENAGTDTAGGTAAGDAAGEDTNTGDGGDTSSETTTSASSSSGTKGMTLSYPHIDPSGLDNTAIPWGPGVQKDELNRPIASLSYQQEYKDYNVDFIVPTEDKVLYLTFDEGYENGCSGRILDTLRSHNAQGVFFVTKSYAESCPDLVRRMIDEGHVVGNHTVHHPSDGMQAHDIDYQTNEVMELHNYIKDTFGYEMCLFRYPTGMFSKQSLAVVSNCGYRSSFWSFAYADWDRDNQPNPSEALQKLESCLHPGAVYLLHAVSETNTNILDEFLTYAESQGYTIGHYLDTLQ